MDKSLKIAIFGSGSVGCYFGYQFMKAGFPPDFIARGKNLSNLLENGLAVMGGDFSDHVSPNVKEKLDGEYDIIFVCVKSKDTVAAAGAIRGHLKDNGGVTVSLQNGVENSQILIDVLGRDKVVPACIYLTANFERNGVLKFMSKGRLLFGGDKKNTKNLEYLLCNTNVESEFVQDILSAQWGKLLLNLSANPLTALFGKTFGELFNHPESAYLAERLFNEGKRAAALAGAKVEHVTFESVKKQCLAKPNFKTSMLQDVESNKAPETEAILGVIVKTLEKAGEEAPYSDMLMRIMHVKFGGWFHSSPRLAADVLVVQGDCVLLIERRNEPYGWAIPGGFVDLYESMEDAALRELQEETGLKAEKDKIELLDIYSHPSRDKRGHTASAVYVYFLETDETPHADDDAKDAKFFKLSELPEVIAFDHRKVIEDFVKKYVKNGIIEK